jgi:CRISPR-associated protein Csx17
VTEAREHVLGGCRPVPLASYLKALGVLRLVSEQADPNAGGRFP